MPLVIVNLGCEMLYILDQRLKAQSIASDKSTKVLNDVIRTMFDEGFVTDKLFTAQEPYSMASTRKIFDRLAHSSIMRLSESSMDKLFDLMVMGYKYQTLCSTSLQQLEQVTLTHLKTIKEMVASSADAAVNRLIDNVSEMVIKTYSTLSMWQLHQVRQTLCRFFQDKRVKVSLFMQEGIQSQVGRIIMPSPIKPGVGTVKYSGGSETKLSLGSQQVNPDDYFCHPVPLGANMYNKERPKVIPPPRKGDLVGDAIAPAPASEPAKAVAPQAPRQATEQSHTEAKQELELLTALMRIRQPQTDNFRLNLFSEDELSLTPISNPAGDKVPNYSIDGGNDAYKKDSALAELEELNLNSKQRRDDLLDLMDSVS